MFRTEAQGRKEWRETAGGESSGAGKGSMVKKYGRWVGHAVKNSELKELRMKVDVHINLCRLKKIIAIWIERQSAFLFSTFIYNLCTFTKSMSCCEFNWNFVWQFWGSPDVCGFRSSLCFYGESSVANQTVSLQVVALTFILEISCLSNNYLILILFDTHIW